MADCPRCQDARFVCEIHQDKPQFHDDCAGAGMHCSDCNPMSKDAQVVIKRRRDTDLTRRAAGPAVLSFASPTRAPSGSHDAP